MSQASEMLRTAMAKFRTLIASSTGATWTEKARNYLAQYDGDRDGILQRAEVEHLMRVAGTPDPATWAGDWLRLVGYPNGVPVAFMASTIGPALDNPALLDVAAAQLDGASAQYSWNVVTWAIIGATALWAITRKGR